MTKAQKLFERMTRSGSPEIESPGLSSSSGSEAPTAEDLKNLSVSQNAESTTEENIDEFNPSSEGPDIRPMKDWLRMYGHESGITSRYQLNNHGFSDKEVNSGIEKGIFSRSPHASGVLMTNKDNLNPKY